MMFNFWRKYAWFKPKKEGWYQCVVQHGAGLNQSMIMDLYFWFKPDVGGVWIDRRRQEVFLGYKVYKPSRAAIEDNRVWGDEACERIDVVAWKKISRIPLRWRNKKTDE